MTKEACMQQRLDQRIVIISCLEKLHIFSIVYLVSVDEQADLNITLSQPPKTQAHVVKRN